MLGHLVRAEFHSIAGDLRFGEYSFGDPGKSREGANRRIPLGYPGRISSPTLPGGANYTHGRHSSPEIQQGFHLDYARGQRAEDILSRTERTADPGIRRESDDLEFISVAPPEAIAVTLRVGGQEEPRTQKPAKRSPRT